MGLPISAAGVVRPRPSICVVDDDDMVRDSMRAVLESRQYSVSEFASGAALLAGGVAGQADCFVLDVHMPSMTGVEVLSELRAHGIATPVILMTGRRDARIVSQARRLGAVALLDKPVGHLALFDTIRRALDGRAS